VAVFAIATASATHQSLNGMVGGFYPTVIRGNGVGYEFGGGGCCGPAQAGRVVEEADEHDGRTLA